MRSIRTFLIGVLLSAFTLLNFIAVIKGYEKGLETAHRILDEHLQDMAKLLALHSTRVSPTGEFDQIHIAYQIIHKNQLIERSANAPLQPPAQLHTGFGYENFKQTRWRTYSHYESPTDTWVLVAEPQSQRSRIAESIVLRTITPMLVGIPLAGIIIWLTIGLGLKPLRKLSSQLQTKKSTDLTPLQPGKMPAELIPVVNAVDELLARLQQTFEREKSFAADAAHELRTPISILKIHLHNLEASLPAETRALGVVKNSVNQLAHLVEQLLDLYRSSPDAAFKQQVNFDLEPLAQEALALAFTVAQAKNQTLELVSMPLPILGNPFAITTLLNNLIGNAIKYSPVGGSIRVTLTKVPAAEAVQTFTARLVVEDSGPGIPIEKRQLALQRFYRLQPQAERRQPIINDDTIERTDAQLQTEQTGAGLGLAIVAHIVEQHDAHLDMDQSEDLGGLKVTIEFKPDGNIR